MSTSTNESTVPARPDRTAKRRVLLSSLAGTTIEWYEFFIYGLASALVLNKVFFPSFDSVVGTLLSLSTFAVAFVARPVGAAIFGHFGDRLGRKNALVITLTMMGGATFLIGLLPTYATIGALAPILLVLLRLVQGLSLGGEYSGAVLMCVEHAGPRRRGLFGAIVNSGSALGLILSNLVFIAASAIAGPDFLTWGWRLPFLASAVLVVLGLVVRLKVEESPEFMQMRSDTDSRRAPIVETFRKHLRPVLLTALAYIAAGVTFYMAAVFSLSYGGVHLQVGNNTILTLVLLAYLFNSVAMPFFGWLSDRWDRRKIFLISAALLLPTPFIWFALLETRNYGLMLIGFIVLFIPFSANYGVLPTYFSDSFPAHIRYTGMAIGYTLGTILSAAAAPLIATALLAATGGWTAIAAYMGLSAIISLIAAFFLHEQRTTAQAPRSEPTATPTLGGEAVPA
ncbi:MFS transporter [Saccharopolyspora pogona]|uniref:MFS transporter n=1 Tax=Saccharopolyspora pogona TaxID=333966 RepID=UPI00168610F8|nr:MFS transporter [Saccharopolyspora pogona]